VLRKSPDVFLRASMFEQNLLTIGVMISISIKDKAFDEVRTRSSRGRVDLATL
jgi:hypothetical protein